MIGSLRLTSTVVHLLRTPSRFVLQQSCGRPLAPAPQPIRAIGLQTRGAHLWTRSTAATPAAGRLFARCLPLVRSAASKAGADAAAKTTSAVVEGGRKAVGVWLLGCSGMVFVAVVLGGVTRLTESGLSMVTWKLLGERWPQNEAEWVAEFERYQQYPEFQIKNASMNVAEFKFIFFMEYAHRMWGRAIGAAFALPAVYFWSRGYFDRTLKTRSLIFGALIGAQGLMGWYMVKSGLENRFHQPEDVPRVSQYRLAAHLTLAFLLYSGFLWSALDRLMPAGTLSAGQMTPATARFKRLAFATKGMVFLTALTGAFVAGLDAGLVYNTFPKMADRWVPSDLLAFTPTLRNFTENPTTVQFDHRIMGTATLTMITLLYALSRRRVLPRRAYAAATAVCVAGWAQVILGVTTLLHYVPVPLAASHQSGSLVLLSTAIWLTHELKLLKYVPK